VSQSETLRLFVYGSLKRGEANHGVLAGARFISDVRTRSAFALAEIAGYPALVPGDRAIDGELFELPCARLRELDEFEGSAYVRREIALEGGGVAIAYVARDASVGVPLAVSKWGAHGRLC
jgi:gamma-glutamylcyclotransferase (GGCT)/AIG2-like uncharacterized protein YtfP